MALFDTGCFEHDSEGEWGAFNALFGPGVPPPDCQVWLSDFIRVDFVYLYAALVIEYLGRVHRNQLEKDTTRTYALRRLQCDVIGVTASMLHDAGTLSHTIQQARCERERLRAEGRINHEPLPPQPPRLTPLRTLAPAG